MSTIALTPETVAAYREILTNPSAHGFTFLPLDKCFEKSEEVTANHKLFEQYEAYIQKPLPKVMFYIIMEELFGKFTGHDPKGLLGYHLKMVAHGTDGKRGNET